MNQLPRAPPPHSPMSIVSLSFLSPRRRPCHSPDTSRFITSSCQHAFPITPIQFCSSPLSSHSPFCNTPGRSSRKSQHSVTLPGLSSTHLPHPIPSSPPSWPPSLCFLTHTSFSDFQPYFPWAWIIPLLFTFQVQANFLIALFPRFLIYPGKKLINIVCEGKRSKGGMLGNTTIKRIRNSDIWFQIDWMHIKCLVSCIHHTGSKY